MKRSKSAGSLAHNQRSVAKSSPERGIPWRTAARAAKSSITTSTVTTSRQAVTSRRNNPRNEEIIESIIDNLTSSEFMTTTRPTSSKSVRSRPDIDYFEHQNKPISTQTSSSMKELLIILRKEQETKSRLEDMLIKVGLINQFHSIFTLFTYHNCIASRGKYSFKIGNKRSQRRFEVSLDYTESSANRRRESARCNRAHSQQIPTVS